MLKFEEVKSEKLNVDWKVGAAAAVGVGMGVLIT